MRNGMTLSEEQTNAFNLMREGKNIFLSGKAGSGKSYLLSAYCEQAQCNGKKVAVTASTGIAAHLLSGRTIHSLLKYRPGMNTKNCDFRSKAEDLTDIDILIIDEISMLNGKMLQYIYNCCREIDKELQVIVTGDFFQLPPVHGNYAFESDAWQSFGFIPCIMNTVHRQNNYEFIKNLNKARYGDPSCLSYFIKNTSRNKIKDGIYMCARNDEADQINERARNRLSGPEESYYARYAGKIDFDKTQFEDVLLLKKGLRVMTLINDYCGAYQNGSMGTVVDMSKDAVTVLLDNGNEINVGYYRIKMDREDSDQQTDFYQIPLRPAHAITIHKSQGQTFESANILACNCKSYGQLYVALSRCKTIENMYLEIDGPRNLVASYKVKQFYDKQNIAANY